MAINITVKNTFLNVDTSNPVAEFVKLRRSNSIPRTWKPGGSSDCDDSPHSDDSTSASDKAEHFPAALSDCDQELPDYQSDCADDHHSDYSSCRWADISDECPADRCEECPSQLSDDGTGKSKVTLSLVDMVSSADARHTDGKVRSKLSSKAKVFASVRQPPEEVKAVLAATVEALLHSKDIVDVQVRDGGMGGTTMIMADSSSDDPDALWTFSLAKDALLNSAEQSENTYILGYGARPFNSLDTLSFSANIASVPLDHQNTACWETYEKGFCPRCASCRWDHPTEADMMRVIVMIKTPSVHMW